MRFYNKIIKLFKIPQFLLDSSEKRYMYMQQNDKIYAMVGK